MNARPIGSVHDLSAPAHIVHVTGVATPTLLHI